MIMSTPIKVPYPWIALTDSASGSVYYENQLTDETSWDAPPIPFSAKKRSASFDAPAPWQALLDDSTGKIFFSNTATDEVAWMLPQNAQSTVDDSEPTPVHIPNLPAPWLAFVDKSTGQQYYENSVTNETVWSLPPEIAKIINPLYPWDPLVDVRNGQTYFENVETGETLWDLKGRIDPSVLKRWQDSKDAKQQFSSQSSATAIVPTTIIPVSEAVQVNTAVSAVESSVNHANLPLSDISADASMPEPVPLNIPNLPAPWLAFLDAQSGQRYFENPVTGETAWSLPPEIAKILNPLYPWDPLVDQQTGKSYFENVETGETSWDLEGRVEPAALQKWKSSQPSQTQTAQPETNHAASTAVVSSAGKVEQTVVTSEQPPAVIQSQSPVAHVQQSSAAAVQPEQQEPPAIASSNSATLVVSDSKSASSLKDLDQNIEKPELETIAAHQPQSVVVVDKRKLEVAPTRGLQQVVNSVVNETTDAPTTSAAISELSSKSSIAVVEPAADSLHVSVSAEKVLHQEPVENRLAVNTSQEVFDQEPPKPIDFPNLPAPWYAFVDEGSGEQYFENSETGETAWTLPVEVLKVMNPLHPWVKLTDLESGAVYFENVETGVTAWDLEGLVDVDTLFKARELMHADLVKRSKYYPWVEMVDEASGDTYFENVETGETKWSLEDVKSSRVAPAPMSMRELTAHPTLKVLPSLRRFRGIRAPQLQSNQSSTSNQNKALPPPARKNLVRSALERASCDIRDVPVAAIQASAVLSAAVDRLAVAASNPALQRLVAMQKRAAEARLQQASLQAQQAMARLAIQDSAVRRK